MNSDMLESSEDSKYREWLRKAAYDPQSRFGTGQRDSWEEDREEDWEETSWEEEYPEAFADVVEFACDVDCPNRETMVIFLYWIVCAHVSERHYQKSHGPIEVGVDTLRERVDFLPRDVDVFVSRAGYLLDNPKWNSYTFYDRWKDDLLGEIWGDDGRSKGVLKAPRSDPGRLP